MTANGNLRLREMMRTPRQTQETLYDLYQVHHNYFISEFYHKWDLNFELLFAII